MPDRILEFNTEDLSGSPQGYSPRFLIRTKIEVPRSHSIGPRLERQPLIDLVEEYSDRRVTAVCAPAGYGKTSLVADWARVTDRTVAWFSLDNRDNDPYRFLFYLRAAVSRLLGPDDVLTLESSRVAPLDLEFDSIVSLAQAVDGPATLVFDELHLITNRWVLEALDYFAAFIPDDLHLLFISRATPQISWSRLDLHGDYVELDFNALRVTPEELAELFEQPTFAASWNAEIEHILDTTGGWVAAVRVLTMLAQEDNGTSGARTQIDRFANNDTLIEYLGQEVLSRLGPEQVSQLRAVAITERMCGELFEHLTGVNDGYEALLDLKRAGLFLEPIGEDNVWFRLHPIFRQVLLQDTKLQLPANELRAQHDQTSQWFAANNFPEDAVVHAVRAENWRAAAEFLTPVAYDLIAQNRSGQVVSWIENIPSSLTEKSVDLMLCHAAAITDSRQSGRLSQLVQQYSRFWSDDPDPGYRAQGALTEARMDILKGDWRGAIEHAQAVLDLEGEVQADMPVRARYQLARAYWLAGKPRRTLPILSELVSDAQHEATEMATHIAMAAEVALGRLRVDLGDVEVGTNIIRNVYEHYGSTHPRVRVPALMWLASVEYRRNNLDRASELLEDLADFEFTGNLARFESRWHLYNGRLHAARGDLDAAREAYLEAIDVAEHLNDYSWWSTARSNYAKFALRTGDDAMITDWLFQTPRPDPSSSDVTDVDESLTYAILLLGTNRYLDALDILRPLASQAQMDGRIWTELAGYLLQARAYQATGDRAASQRQLGAALVLAQSRGAVRPFIDAGPDLIDILKHTEVERERMEFVELILGAASIGPTGSSSTTVDPDESLTPRELQILRLISLGLSNQAIADRTDIAVSTVKRHVTNILRKLGADNRTEALYAARRRRILKA